MTYKVSSGTLNSAQSVSQPDDSLRYKNTDTVLGHGVLYLSTSQPKLVLIYRRRRDGRLSWPSLLVCPSIDRNNSLHLIHVLTGPGVG